MPQISITINSNSTSANGSGTITDPALIEAALTVLDAITASAATDAPGQSSARTA